MTVRNAMLGAVAAVTAVALAACGGSPASPTADGKIKVVASTNVWGSVVKAVGGDAVEVSAIINDPSGDPHSYNSKPSDVAAVKDAQLVIFNGGGYDDFFATLLTTDTEKAKKIETFPLSGKIDSHSHEEPPASEEPHDHEVNEHVWYDLDTVRKVADQAAADLSEIAPDKKAAFTDNAAEFGRKVEELHQKLDGVGKGKKVLQTEPVAHYLLEAAGVEDVTPETFSKAVEGETDIPAAALADVTRLVDEKQVAAVVDNVQTENTAVKQVVEKAGRAGVPVVAVTETLPEGVTGYLDWMTKQVDALAQALRG
ncbi:zinc ABC transporter substrate-binding protein [Actinosynnema sp. NPDC047251]|uniref:ABC-type transporter, substrate-binding lipoprotein n=1 Tax=Saccharothrix espanaensis (strain ATCC 51144 / DSM 44229 / JCM 9112 / NBRC 15066 / NRRL 15764) TaxID=1179773 RepID=K0JSB3_SACES|nr:zinc ABC transporter substrate-binding protein [Saccharothrix espanaensis]CCH27719.1 ABC-type transporter, substrate-binding lipoprotein [Saccharothrix espanaensis DSM 44229]